VRFVTRLFGTEGNIGQPSRLYAWQHQITRFGAAIGNYPDGRLPIISACTCAAHDGCAATVRDSSRSAASAGQSCHGEHPHAKMSVAVMLADEACQRPRFAKSDVRHSH
jgi:hypothetical protein